MASGQRILGLLYRIGVVMEFFGERQGIRVRFLLWGGVGRTTYFSNKIQSENVVLFLHKGDLECG